MSEDYQNRRPSLAAPAKGVALTAAQESELRQRAREHFAADWERWEIAGLLIGDARAVGLTLALEDAERIVSEAVPYACL